MRPTNEVEDGARLLEFAQGLRTLLIPAQDVLEDTVKELYWIVYLSDKVIPLKTYFNMVQELQRTKNYAKEFQKNPSGNEKALLQAANRKLCTEDVFVVACSYLQVEIARSGFINYLAGEAPGRKETKQNRTMLDLDDELVLKNLARTLARPDAERGQVERSQMVSGFNHLVKLRELYKAMEEVVARLKKDPSLRHIDLRKELSLTQTDFDKIVAMAMREGYTQIKRRPETQKYPLTAKNQKRIDSYAKKARMSSKDALNKVVEDFFKMVEKAEKAALNRRKGR